MNITQSRLPTDKQEFTQNSAILFIKEKVKIENIFSNCINKHYGSY